MELEPLRGSDGFKLVTIRDRCFLSVGVPVASEHAFYVLIARAHCWASIAPLPTGTSNRPRYLRMYRVPMAGTPSPVDESSGFKLSVAALILDRNGVLHEEPLRILLDDMGSPVQSNSLLALIGAGCHRLSAIGSRVGQPATNLSRPLSRLIDLGYVRRELPFGESTRSTKRSLDRLDDPFLLFWYRFVAPNRSPSRA